MDSHLSLLAAISIILWIVAMYDVIQRRLKYLTFNFIWLLIIIMIPFIGPILYLFLRKNMDGYHPRKFNPDFRRVPSKSN